MIPDRLLGSAAIAGKAITRKNAVLNSALRIVLLPIKCPLVKQMKLRLFSSSVK
jgi:hypothetical protein